VDSVLRNAGAGDRVHDFGGLGLGLGEGGARVALGGDDDGYIKVDIGVTSPGGLNRCMQDRGVGADGRVPVDYDQRGTTINTGDWNDRSGLVRHDVGVAGR
jgi:hypothetical protein